MKQAGLINIEYGITSNPSESFNATLHRMSNHSEVPPDVIILTLFYNSNYYNRELIRGFYQDGNWKLKVGLKRIYGHNPSEVPSYKNN